MLERGGISFVALLVINPVAILLYQNYSLAPVSSSELASRELLKPQRSISSTAAPQQVDLNNLKAAGPANTNCNSEIENCPVKSVE